MKERIIMAFFLVAVLPLLAFAAPDTVFVQGFIQSGGVEGTLNTAITGASTPLSNHVFKLTQFDKYVLTGTITVPLGDHLTIVADEPGTDPTTAPPQILWSTSGSVSTNFTFDCFGDLTLKNLWLVYANASGTQLGTSLKIDANPDSSAAQYATFEGCLFDYSQIGADGSGAVSVTSKHFRGKFTNCFFRNCSDSHFRYYGRAVSFPFNTTGWHTDSLTFTNCTFTNLGYVIMQEGSEWTDYIKINHCTFVNTIQFCLESTWWHYLSITNSVFLNMFMFGDLGANNGNPNGGTFAIDSVKNFGFTPPFGDQDRHILFTNSSYAHDTWLTDFYQHNAYSDTVSDPVNLPKPMPMLGPRTLMFFDTTDGQGHKSYPFMNRKDLFDNTNPNLLIAPSDIPALQRFLYYKWTSNADTNWAFDPASTINQSWPLSENLKVGNTVLKTAAMGGFPLGDLYRWGGSAYATWKAQEATEDAQIQAWLDNGIPAGVPDQRPGVPVKFELSQNYPNPFNPATTIDYSIPRSGHVSLKVYDLLGRQVATLFDGEQKVGNYSVKFDGANLASGVYFYRLQSGTNAVSRKLMLLK